MFKACVKNARYYQNYKKRNKMKLKGKLRSFYEDVMLKIVFLFDCSAITQLIDITLYFYIQLPRKKREPNEKLCKVALYRHTNMHNKELRC